MSNNRSILVTGASSGIGKAISARLLSEGHEIFGIGRRFTSDTHHKSFHPFSIDLSDLDTLCSKLTPFTHVDTIICNAGRGHFAHLEEFSPAQIRSLIDLNFLSHVYIIKTLLPHLKKKGHADIIFIGSEAGLVGQKKGSIYSASKFALRGFAQSLREECRTSGVRVSMIQPGLVRTPFYDTLSFTPGSDETQAIEPEDIAETISYILGMRKGTICDEILLSPHKKVIEKK